METHLDQQYYFPIVLNMWVIIYTKHYAPSSLLTIHTIPVTVSPQFVITLDENYFTYDSGTSYNGLI